MTRPRKKGAPHKGWKSAAVGRFVLKTPPDFKGELCLIGQQEALFYDWADFEQREPGLPVVSVNSAER